MDDTTLNLKDQTLNNTIAVNESLDQFFSDSPVK
jgi:hypothetical protein